MELVGKGEEQSAEALLERAPHSQFRQLLLGENPTDEDEGDSGEPETIDFSDRCWKNSTEEIWMTDFPPPPGFSGYESCDYGDPDDTYERACTAEESAILEADAAAELTAEQAEDAEARDLWFALLEGETTEG